MHVSQLASWRGPACTLHGRLHAPSPPLPMPQQPSPPVRYLEGSSISLGLTSGCFWVIFSSSTCFQTASTLISE